MGVLGRTMHTIRGGARGPEGWDAINAGAATSIEVA